jgi:hypothetical protein
LAAARVAAWELVAVCGCDAAAVGAAAGRRRVRRAGRPSRESSFVTERAVRGGVRVRGGGRGGRG